MSIQYWNYVDPWGKEHDIQCETKEGAINWANEEYSESLQDEPLANGDERSAEGELILYKHDEGDPEEVKRVKIIVSHEHYHGDLKEHGTYY